MLNQVMLIIDILLRKRNHGEFSVFSKIKRLSLNFFNFLLTNFEDYYKCSREISGLLNDIFPQ